MNAVTTRPSTETGNPLIPTTLDEAARLAKIMSDMELVPAHLRSKPADCMLIIEQAIRWRMSPFAVAQATSVLQGKLNFEGKLVAAALHTSGILSTRLRYDYEGDGPTRAIRVSAVLGGEREPREVLVKLADVKTGNSMWTKQPDQQLSYAGARIWARRHAPEVMLGVYAPEEFESSEERPEPRSVQSTVVKPEPRPAPRPNPTPDDAVQAMNDAAPKQPINRMSKQELDDATGGDRIIEDWSDAPAAPTKPKPSSPRAPVAAWVATQLRSFREAMNADDYNAIMGQATMRDSLMELERDWSDLYRDFETVRQETLDRIAAEHAGQPA